MVFIARRSLPLRSRSTCNTIFNINLHFTVSNRILITMFVNRTVC